MELSGVVEEAAPGSRFSVGDEVVAVTTFFGTGRGAQAALVSIDEASVAMRPAAASWEEASTLPMSALTAWRALDQLSLSPGAEVLVLGAAGAVGTYAVELAVARGLVPIALAREADRSFLEGVGARVITGEALFSAALNCAGAVIDTCVFGSKLCDSMQPGSRLAVLRPPSEVDRERAFASGVELLAVSVRDMFHATAVIEELVSLASRGQLTLRVAHALPAADAAEAHRLVDAGGLRGRVVLTW
jgi:NADPH:quinone reductase-like Zn-dependent oxidoreductase